MKKIASFTMAFVIILSLLLAGCSNGGSNYLGTWTAAKAEHDGQVLSLSELEKLGDSSLSNVSFVIAEGGKGCISAAGANMPLEWSESSGGIKLGDRELNFTDNQFIMEYNGVKVYFDKTSDSQDIPSD